MTFQKGNTWGRLKKGKRRLDEVGDKNPNWTGGRGITTQGYISIYSPNHPKAKSRKYILEHRLVMEKHIGRYLESHEIVHGGEEGTDFSQYPEDEYLAVKQRFNK